MDNTTSYPNTRSVKKPSILILDEVSSGLDEATERYIQKVLSNLPADMIVLMVTHYQPHISICNKVLVINNKGVCQQKPDSGKISWQPDGCTHALSTIR